MNSLTLKSPAKLNLYLKVINKRSDGFHNIETLFERISLFDDVCFQKNNTGKTIILCDHPHVPTGPKNLVYQVSEILRKNYKITEGVTIMINKRIPVAAGLAGGSSNAATALLGLNKIWGLQLTQRELLSYAAKIGSDVSFFIHNLSWGLGLGRGEKIKKVAIKEKFWHILVVPKVKVYTWKVYANIKIERMNVLTKKDQDVNILIHSLKKQDFFEIGRRIINDLEKETILLCPRLKRLKDRLQGMETSGVMVSGSGPSIFGITKNKKDAEVIKHILKKRFSQVFVVQTF